jgi:hypothetical protein
MSEPPSSPSAPVDAPLEPRTPPRAGGAVASLRAVLRSARTRLVQLVALDAAAAGAAGALVALGVALVVVGLAPFSIGLRAALLALIPLGGAVGLSLVVYRRGLPLRADLFVATRLEAALLRRGDDARDLVRGAVELLDPSLDHSAGRSRALADAHIASATARVQQGRALGSLLGVALEGAVPSLVALAAIVGLVGGWRVLAPESFARRADLLFSSEHAQKAADAAARSAVPLVSDLVITLRYPAYMAARDDVIPGSSGDISAPKGTEVTVQGRADRVLKSASALIGEKEVGATVDGRALTVRFTVDADTTYRFKLLGEKGGVELDPVAHAVKLVADQAPNVFLDAPAADETKKIDEDVDLAFHATDDVGITRFAVVVRRQGSARTPYTKDLLLLPTALKEARGKGSFAIADTGARPGDKLSVTVEAYDNDTVSGPRAGSSVTRVITVFSAAEQHKNLIARLSELLEQMTDSLGDELEAPLADAPDASTDFGATYRTHKQIGQRHEDTKAKIAEVLAVLRMDELAPAPMRRALANLKVGEDKAIDAKRATLKLIGVPVDAGRSAPVSSWRRLSVDQRALVLRFEKDILYLDQLVAMEKIAQAQQLAEDLVRAQKDLRELMEQYKKTGDAEARKALLDEIAKMREQMRDLMDRLAELQKDIPDEYMNEEAFKADEMMEKAKDIDQLLEEGKLEEAQKQLEEMLKGAQELVDELQKTGEEMGGDEFKELREKLERFADDLQALQKGEEQALSETDDVMEKAQREMEKKLGAKLKQALAELKAKTAKAKTSLEGVTRAALMLNEAEDNDLAQARAEDLLRALESGDLEDAVAAAEEAAGAAQSALRTVSDRTRGRFGDKSPETLDAKKRMEEGEKLLDEVRKKLQEMQPDPSDMLDQQARQQMQKGADQQDQLAENAQRLERLMEEIGREAPVFGPNHKRQLQEARQLMEKASREMKGKNVRGARSAQRQARQQLAALEKSLREQSGGSGGGPGGMPMPFPNGGAPGSEGDDQRDQDGDGRRASKEDVKIPDGSEFKVPDQYRKELIDAMREGVPDSWASEVKKYYEELIK